MDSQQSDAPIDAVSSSDDVAPATSTSSSMQSTTTTTASSAFSVTSASAAVVRVSSTSIDASASTATATATTFIHPQLPPQNDTCIPLASPSVCTQYPNTTIDLTRLHAIDWPGISSINDRDPLALESWILTMASQGWFIDPRNASKVLMASSCVSAGAESMGKIRYAVSFLCAIVVRNESTPHYYRDPGTTGPVRPLGYCPSNSFNVPRPLCHGPCFAYASSLADALRPRAACLGIDSVDIVRTTVEGWCQSMVDLGNSVGWGGDVSTGQADVSGSGGCGMGSHDELSTCGFSNRSFALDYCKQNMGDSCCTGELVAQQPAPPGPLDKYPKWAVGLVATVIAIIALVIIASIAFCCRRRRARRPSTSISRTAVEDIIKARATVGHTTPNDTADSSMDDSSATIVARPSNRPREVIHSLPSATIAMSSVPPHQQQTRRRPLPLPPPPIPESCRFVVIRPFNARNEQECTVAIGEVLFVDVIYSDGWCTARKEAGGLLGRKGFVPFSYLAPVHPG